MFPFKSSETINTTLGVSASAVSFKSRHSRVTALSRVIDVDLIIGGIAEAEGQKKCQLGESKHGIGKKR
tara:strand:+ start:5803 stop:6009 length:207 start_codon:yes stop_codon:yes gene_type:complete